MKKPNNLIRGSLVWAFLQIIWTAVWYLILSFFSAEWNPILWSLTIKVIFGILMASGLVFSISLANEYIKRLDNE